MVPGEVIDLGQLPYAEAYQRQLALVNERKTGAGVDTLLVVEHPHVITIGRARDAGANVVAAGDVEVVAVERGGDATYHGPGQLVAYPVLLLGEGERDLHRFLRNLEEAMIRTLAEHGLAGARNPGKTGVWIGPRKLASIGIACRRWVTFHGLALNVNTDLRYFARINPCGFEASIMSSMARELEVEAVDLERVKQQLVRHLGDVFERAFSLPSS